MQRWPRVAIRTFAVLNIFLGVFGLLALLSSMYGRVRLNPWSQNPPYFAQAYYLQAAMNLVFVLIAIWTGPHLWRLRERGRTICNILFCAEIAYFWGGTLLCTLAFFIQGKEPLFCHALAVSAGGGNMGVVLQQITAYPLIALIVLNLAYARLNRSSRMAHAPGHDG
jgi:hypothetical protein